MTLWVSFLKKEIGLNFLTYLQLLIYCSLLQGHFRYLLFSHYASHYNVQQKMYEVYLSLFKDLSLAKDAN